MEVVINKCYGGFGLSDEAFEELIKMGWKTTKYKEDEEGDLIEVSWGGTGFVLSDKWKETASFRSNKDIVAVVKKLGEKANGEYAQLKVVDVPDNVEITIEEYDGMEWVAEKHRVWG